MDGNTTHAWYFCSRHIPNDDNGDVITIYGNQMKQFPNYPTICDVCNGNMTGLSVFKDKVCNIPSVCPVTKVGQTRCTCEGKELGDGLCCK
ncbi:Hypothetical predicted protein [Mytilus galloprovincialis]|nr:Hypothetical predicted protein [Mytilus galloprovincialis]